MTRSEVTRSWYSTNFQELAATLREARIEQGLRLKDVADAIPGYPRVQDVSKWESGVEAPSFMRLERWAHALGYSVRVVKQ
jgi:transcriptional regulator with XRE-family HTH domain